MRNRCANLPALVAWTKQGSVTMFNVDLQFLSQTNDRHRLKIFDIAANKKGFPFLCNQLADLPCRVKSTCKLSPEAINSDIHPLLTSGPVQMFNR